MINKDIFILTKDGVSLFSCAIGEEKQVDPVLVSGFLSAVNSFATEMGWPSGVSLIRSGSIECRIWSGRAVNSAIVINTKTHLGDSTEQLIEDLAQVICERFEAKYPYEIAQTVKDKFTEDGAFASFECDVQELMAQFRNETFQLYQKLILVEGMYAHVPQKWCLNLMGRLSAGEADVTKTFKGIRMYSPLMRAIEKVNQQYAPVWELFGIPIYNPK